MTSLHFTPLHSTTHHFTSLHTASLQITPSHSTLFHFTPPHSTPHYLTPFHTTSSTLQYLTAIHTALEYHTKEYLVTLNHFTSPHINLILHYSILRHLTPLYITSLHLTSILSSSHDLTPLQFTPLNIVTLTTSRQFILPLHFNLPFAYYFTKHYSTYQTRSNIHILSRRTSVLVIRHTPLVPTFAYKMLTDSAY